MTEKLGGYKSKNNILICNCPYCKEEKSFQYKEESETYVCTNCSEFGDRKDLSKKLAIEIDPPILNNVKTDINNLKGKVDIYEVDDNILNFFVKRGISEKTLEKYCVAMKGSENIIHFMYHDHLGYVRANKQMIYKDEKLSTEWISDYKSYLWNIMNVPDKNIIIVNDIVDALALIDCGIENVISMSDNKNITWLEDCYEYLSSRDNIYLLFNKKISKELSYKIHNRLGAKKTKIIDNPYGSAAKLCSAGQTQLLNDLRNISGIKTVEIKGLIPASQIEKYTIPEAISSGDTAFDALLAGIRMYELTLVSGTPSSGKSTILEQICANFADMSERCAIFSREHSMEEVKEHIYCVYAGSEGVSIIENKFDPSIKDRFLLDDRIRNKMDELYGDYLDIYSDDSSADPDSILRIIEESYKKKGTRIFVIDNLMTIDLDLSKLSRNDAETQFIKDLKKLTRLYPIHIFLVAHPKKMDDPKKFTGYDVAGTSNIYNLLNNLVYLRRMDKKEKSAQDKADESGINKKRRRYGSPSVMMTLIKDRKYGKNGKQIPICYDPIVGRIHGRFTNPNYKYRWQTE